jgi:hypothetical protein
MASTAYLNTISGSSNFASNIPPAEEYEKFIKLYSTNFILKLCLQHETVEQF